MATATIAKGCFGKVYKEKYKDTWSAMKKVESYSITKEDLVRECKVYLRTKHDNVVKLLGIPWLQNGRWHIPLEWISGETLELVIFKKELSRITLTRQVKVKIIEGMCEGLSHLHSKNIVHQDLKPDNIMVEFWTHRAVIIDLNLAKFCVNGLSSAQNIGNPAYAAPEIQNETRVRDKPSDVWAMGKIIAELLKGGRMPTAFLSSFEMQYFMQGNPYASVLCSMVKTDPTKRTSMVWALPAVADAGVAYVAGTGSGNNASGAVVPMANQAMCQAAPYVPNYGGAVAAQYSYMYISPNGGFCYNEMQFMGFR